MDYMITDGDMRLERYAEIAVINGYDENYIVSLLEHSTRRIYPWDSTRNILLMARNDARKELKEIADVCKLDSKVNGEQIGE